ncbi:hypothetical protein Cme02nite_06550 [Catellatospora methionotrophica]|uniref:Uncharacterized protein n=1 Tax=Catellatospora methionotrophica TaxID=121620 RepID=A0A8J3L0V4_9ACTN|nr:hypothetical protein [Catellatospora methionotrophica]GIG12323.1 hypothetical protein Cme02nite_06550 [Catellatospora methionotrophica]
MLEFTVLSAVLVLFKAAFAGEDLDRKVGADVISTMLSGLLRTTSPTDPVLLKVYEIAKELNAADYRQAMSGGHRYLAEARLGTGIRPEKLQLARAQLVDAASAAARMDVPMLIANAEFAVAKCDALLAAPLDAAMALDRAAAALEQAIEALDDSGATYRLRMLREAKSAQDGSVSNWLTRAADRDLIRQRDLDNLVKAADDLQSELLELTALYSEVQTAALAADGAAQPVLWAPPEGQSVQTGLDAKAVTTATADAPVRGFGLTLQVQQQRIARDAAGGLTVALALKLTVHDERLLHCRVMASPTARPAAPGAGLRGLTGILAPLNPPGATSVLVPPGSHQRVLTLPVEGGAVDAVKIRISRPTGLGRQASTGGCILIPVSA